MLILMAESGNESEKIFTGSARAPGHMTRRDFLKLAGLVGTTTLLAACGASSDLSPIEAQATQQANTPEGQRIADILPPSLLSGLTHINITAQESYHVVGDQNVGTGQVYLETDSHLVVLTAEHLGKGIFWKYVDLSFPYGDQMKQIRVDARIGAPNGPVPTENDWWIENITPESDVQNNIFHPIRAMVIKKPAGWDQYVTRPEYGTLTPYQGEPASGDIFYCGGYPAGTGGSLTFTELKYKGMTTVPHLSGDLQLHEFKGAADNGMSGGVIVSRNGECLSMLSGGRADGKIVWGIPFVQNLPLKDILPFTGK